MIDIIRPEADKPRLICDYAGLQVFDARETIRVRLISSHVPPGIIGCFKVEGFRKRPDGDWEARNTPINLFAAQAIANEFFPGIA